MFDAKAGQFHGFRFARLRRLFRERDGGIQLRDFRFESMNPRQESGVFLFQAPRLRPPFNDAARRAAGFSQQELDALLALCGFEILAKFGDYDGAAFTAESSKQLLVCRYRPAS